MKAALLTAIRTIEIADVPDPRIERDDEVLLRIRTVGVCGSDMHYFRTGRIGDQIVEFPWTLGHECAAEVVRSGPAVRGLRPAQRVAVDPLIVCGRCDQCLSGRRHTCRNQKFLGCPGQKAGSLAELLVMPVDCCFPVPDSMTDYQSALVEPFSIGLYASRLGGDPAGKTAAVLGAGPIGLCVLAALRAQGAAEVFVTDIRDNRAALAGRLGADWTGNPRDRDVVAEVLQRRPEGVDLAFECAGEQETLDQCVDLLRPGGALLMVGIPELERTSFEVSKMRRKELRLLNVRRQNECVQPAIEMIAGGRVNLDAMVTHEFSLDETQQAADIVADYRDGAVKAMINL